ncbi:hypothetical protein D6850_04160 [Roseovarius spongiae]|uniref:Uncharacterized protein n=1 Tax=Roseovarius spongiae TaxID=2320272 RepID=A0A3A8AYY4_9RHOB|nr:hypothetical protein [Roseovarius spongiae]RKF16739.1 hypothetical protein D6850_04160 [Roseovarius spongiae]
MRAALLILVLALPAGAGDAPRPPERAECNSCNARHKALQRLQAKRRAMQEECDTSGADAQEGCALIPPPAPKGQD